MEGPMSFENSGHNTANAANHLNVENQKNIFILPPPPRRRGSLAAGWVERHTRLPPGESPTEWVNSIREFLSEPDAKRLKAEYEALWNENSEPFNELKQALRNEESDNNMSSTWPEVMKELARAKEYHQEGYRRQSTILKMLLDFGKHSASFSKWLEHLPRKDYGGPVCGAFKRILSDATDTHEFDKSAFESITRIPAILDNTNQYLKMCSDDRWTFGLAKKTLELFNIIFMLFTKVLESSSECVGNEANHKSDVENMVKKLESYMRELDYEAKKCNTVALDQPEEQRRHKMEQQPGIQIYVTFNNFASSNPQLDRNGQLVAQERLKGQVSSMLPPSNKRPRRCKELMSKVQKASGLNSKALIRLLVYNHVLTTADVDECGIPGHLEEGQMQRLSKLTRMDAFQIWLRDEKKPSAILVHGNFESSSIHSPISFLCARLVYAMTYAYQKNDEVVVLSYFCGLRSDPWDPRANAVGVMVDMAGQLLSYLGDRFEFDLGFVDENWQKKIANDDLSYLCRLFRKLVSQLSGRRLVVFCLIDSISTYETNKLRKDTDVLLKELTKLVDLLSKRRAKLLFKLLVTDAGTSNYAWQHFQSEEILEMSEVIDGGGEETLDL